MKGAIRAMNRIILTGRITKDLEIKQAGETNILNFSLAVYRDKDNTDFFDCTAFNKTAELIVQYCKKGSKILVSGALRNNNYEKDGKKVYQNNVVINEVEFLEKMEKEETNEN
jgi:single-strand DNA-binding protein